MYAVIRTGGKQEKVSEGQQLEVELLGLDQGDDVSFEPLMVVDGDRVLAEPVALSGASVSARVLRTSKGPKVTGFTYKPKSNNRRRWGHRQRYTTIEITGITAPAGAGSRRKPPRRTEKES